MARSTRSRALPRGASLVQYVVVIAIVLASMVVGMKVFGGTVTKAAECQGAAVEGVAGGAGDPCGANAVAKPGASVGTVAALPQGPGDLTCSAMGCAGQTPTADSALDDDDEVLPEPGAFSSERGSYTKKKEPETNYNVVRLGTIKGVPFVRGKGTDRAVHPADVSQGQLGDCWFVSSLAVLANQKPSLLQNNLRVVGPGQYSVRLFLDGRWRNVKVDNRFPIAFRDRDHEKKKWVWRDNGGGPVFIQPGQMSKNGPELWPMIYESAIAKARGGYNGIDGGSGADALQVLTGQPSIEYDPSKVSFKKIVEYYKAGYAIVAGTRDPKGGELQPLFKDDTLVTGHEYWVESIDAAKRTVTLRNPWGWDQKPVTISWDDFKRYYDEISVNPITERRRRR